ncbi:IclR family transcriptional regulator [Marmoricola endophyticus]|uniref:IclR family transcriptional regulator n=1 Tax=Marmoricola endophyticus TaxID=2040280 RepID=A0A917F440_9ACTN|nr:IclR family transcriptional regulator [Marmoricola endophyticus]
MDRAMVLLAAVAESSATDATAQILGERTGINRATVWRILTTLEAHDMVTRDARSGQWSIGAGAVRVARAAGLDALARSARQVLSRLSLQTGETAGFAALQGSTLTYLGEVVPPDSTIASWLGHPAPLHATSTGKAYLAMLPDEEVPALVGSDPVRFNDATVTDLSALRDELGRVRERGFAECRGEYDAAVWGVASPLLDNAGRPVAVLSVWGPVGRVSPARFEALGALTQDAARSLSWR